VWGSGSEGQLGLGIAECEVPSLLKFRSKVAFVACGYYHTAVITGNFLNASFVQLQISLVYFLEDSMLIYLSREQISVSHIFISKRSFNKISLQEIFLILYTGSGVASSTI
jgi:hypothetical protein